VSQSPSTFKLRLAAEYLAAGGVVCHPTEAVWGLACLPNNEQAVARLIELKQRDPEKGLILVADKVERFAPLMAKLPADAQQQLLASWPGPNTWVVPDTEVVPVWVRGRFDSVAIRVSKHPLTAALCAAADSPLVSSSANPAGRQPAKTLWQAWSHFAHEVDYFLHGVTDRQQKPTTIRDALSGARIR